MRVPLCPPSPALRLNFPAGDMGVLHDDACQLRPATTAIANAAIVRLTMTIVADWPGVLVRAG